jgi:ribosome biogenesis GTPase / thiamine phosphate phosphatase
LALMPSPAEPALVVAAYGRRGIIELPDGRELASQVRGRGLRACCGDRVQWTMPGGLATALLTGIGPRRNELARQATRSPAAETVAANLTHLAVVVASLPEPDLFLTDRYVCAARLIGCEVAILLNKADLSAAMPAELGIYAELGHPMFRVSARTGAGLADFREWLGTGTGILVGQSGVGKSSLLNALVPGADAATGAISAATDEGKHTTTASVMHRLEGGGRLIDTPGVRDFVPAMPDRRRIALGFAEIDGAADNCRFPNCTHLREPGCAVIAALDKGRINSRRYESFRRLMIMAAQAAERAGPVRDSRTRR